ncbi:hypothetical protein BDN72DRAFT_958573 [Pluteus cervinus]|uniref:Uncharacterized protein n=1 Tax=Pluteus cervinus TaxID=181527 RepID=A0ACD3AYN1_9AGAR|nr:hypothetical protein BDN72DRAFT_958573 [Pluteus cervinus]
MPSVTSSASNSRRLIRGVLFPIYGTTPEEFTIRVSRRNGSRQSFPDINFEDVFFNPGSATIHQMAISIRGKHYIIGGYLRTRGPENQSLSSLTRHIKWQGEVAVVGLGTRIQFLSSPQGPREAINAAASLFMTRLIEARTTGRDIPEQIFIDDDGEIASRDRRQHRIRRSRTLTSADFRFDTPDV